MSHAGNAYLLIGAIITALGLGGCATPSVPTTASGVAPRVDASALLAPRPSIIAQAPTPQRHQMRAPGAAPALLPVVAHSSPTIEPAIYEAPAVKPTPRRSSAHRTARRSPTPTDAPPPAVPETNTDPVSNGRYHWDDDASLGGNVKVVVNLSEQQAYVYRGDSLIAQSSVSTGRQGHRTPTGSFEILQKKRHHNSNLYDNAPMPYMQRLTWDGIALHAGELPGYPASHGCIRLPTGFAKKLFETTHHGTQVVVTQG